MPSKPKPKIAYDQESNVLSVEFRAVKSVDSDIHDNVVVDYDSRGRVVRVNMYNFNFSDFIKGQSKIKEFSKHSQFSFSTT